VTPPNGTPVTAASHPFWRGKRVLVTGAAGFIGSHLVEELVGAGASVRAFVRYNSRNDYGWLEDLPPDVLAEVDIFRGDLANPEAVARSIAGRAVVLHLGALIPIPYSYEHPREYVSANVTGTLNVLEAARRAEVERLVHTSTSEAYGTAQYVPIDELHPLNAQSPYAATKIGADQLALSFWQSFATPVVVVRPFNTYGPRQTARAVIPTIVSQALSGGSVSLGSVTPTRDFLFVRDTALGMMRCAEVEGIEGETINLGTGVEISIGDLAAKIFGLIGVDAEIASGSDRLRPPDSEVERLLADASKAERLLGWQPTVTLDEGLRIVIEWLRGSLAAYKPTIYNV